MMSVTDRDVLHELCDRQMTIMVGRITFLLGLGIGPFFSMPGEESLVPPRISGARVSDASGCDLTLLKSHPMLPQFIFFH